jgi:RimJ/RimL family protein N-acetyltransferase
MEPTETSLPLPATITDGVIVLDGYVPSDAQTHWESEDAEMMRRFDAPRRSTLDEVRGTIQRWQEARSAGGPAITYAMRSGGGVLLGGCEMRRVAMDVAHISYWTYPQYRGRGYAARTVVLLLQEAGRVPGLRYVEAHIDVDNLASRRAVEKNGFVENGSVIDDVWDGSQVTRIRYVIVLPDQSPPRV